MRSQIASAGRAIAVEEPAEIETDQEKHKVYRPAHATEFRRLNCTRPHKRDRDLRKIEVDLHTTPDEESTDQKLPVLTESHCSVNCRQSDDDDRGREIGKHDYLRGKPCRTFGGC